MNRLTDVPFAHSAASVSAAPMPSSNPPVAQAPPMLLSVRIRRNIQLSAIRWLLAAIVFSAATAYTETAEVEERCTNSRAYMMLGLWVIIVTCRVIVGAWIRLSVWRLWNVSVGVDRQSGLIHMYVRAEFLLTLLSVLWTTVGFMYVYGSASICADTPLAQFASALVVILYVNFLLPTILGITFRLLLMCGCSCGVRLLQRAVDMGMMQPQRTPATTQQIQALSEQKYRPGLFPDDHSTCAICMSEYENGDSIRILPCQGRHPFHKACIDPWLRIHANCPVCRQSMLAGDTTEGAGTTPAAAATASAAMSALGSPAARPAEQLDAVVITVPATASTAYNTAADTQMQATSSATAAGAVTETDAPLAAIPHEVHPGTVV